MTFPVFLIVIPFIILNSKMGSSSSLRINDEKHLEAIWVKNHPGVFLSMKGNQTKEDDEGVVDSLISELNLNETKKSNFSSSDFNSTQTQTSDSKKPTTATSNKSDGVSRGNPKNHTNSKGKKSVSAALEAKKNDNSEQIGRLESDHRKSAKSSQTSKTTENDCNSLTTCYQCIKSQECGWCGLERKCILGDLYGGIHRTCAQYSFSACNDMFCSPWKTCGECLFDEDCQWCSSTRRCLVITEFSTDDCEKEDLVVGDGNLCKDLESNRKIIDSLINDFNKTAGVDLQDIDEDDDLGEIMSQ